ncbi:MAG: hypothetical protein N3A55_09675 [Methylohalobius sp.]|nr:hypothetical protein [Methylohalobius sp.]
MNFVWVDQIEQREWKGLIDADPPEKIMEDILAIRLSDLREFWTACLQGYSNDLHSYGISLSYVHGLFGYWKYLLRDEVKTEEFRFYVVRNDIPFAIEYYYYDPDLVYLDRKYLKRGLLKKLKGKEFELMADIFSYFLAIRKASL